MLGFFGTGFFHVQCKVFGRFSEEWLQEAIVEMRARIMVIWTGCVKENKEKRSDFKYSYFRRGGACSLLTHWLQI